MITTPETTQVSNPDPHNKLRFYSVGGLIYLSFLIDTNVLYERFHRQTNGQKRPGGKCRRTVQAGERDGDRDVRLCNQNVWS